jgi:hypothetical protein
MNELEWPVYLTDINGDSRRFHHKDAVKMWEGSEVSFPQHLDLPFKNILYQLSTGERIQRVNGREAEECFPPKFLSDSEVVDWFLGKDELQPPPELQAELNRRRCQTDGSTEAVYDSPDVQPEPNHGCVKCPVTITDIADFWKTIKKKTIRNEMSKKRDSAPAPEAVAEKDNGEKIWEYDDLAGWLKSEWPGQYLPPEYQEFLRELKKIRTD